MSTAHEIELQMQDFARRKWPYLQRRAHEVLARLARLAFDYMEREFRYQEFELHRLVDDGCPHSDID